MDVWGSIGAVALVLIIVAKLYTVSRWKRGLASTSQPASFEGSESNISEPAQTSLNQAEGKTKSTEAWDEGYLILTALLLCGPLGLFLLWRTDKWDSNTKTKLTIGYLAIVLLLIALRFSA